MPKPRSLFRPIFKAKAKGTGVGISRNPVDRKVTIQQSRVPKSKKILKKKKKSLTQKEKDRAKIVAKKERRKSAIARLLGDSEARKGKRYK